MTGAWRPYVFASIFLALLAAFVLGPSLKSPGAEILGHQDTDAYKHVWGQWWVVDNIVTHHRFPITADRMNFPDGGAFWCLDIFNAVLTMPLRLLFSPVAAYNAVVILNVLLAAFCMALFLRDLGVKIPGAVTAAAVFAFSPYMLSFPIASGVAETQVIFFIPLYALALRRAMRGSMPAAIVSGLLIVLAGFACWSYGIYLGLYTFGVIVGTLIWAWRCVKGGKTPPVALNKSTMKRALAFGAVALVCAAPLLWLVKSSVRGGEVVYARPMSVFPHGPAPWDEPALTSFAWIDYFLPGAYGLRTDEFVDKLLYVAYAGYLAAALAALAFVKQWKRVWPYAAGALAFFVFSLGPLFYATHARTGYALYNPVYILMYYAFPLFNVTIHSVDRFAVMVMFFIAVAAGFGAQWIGEKFKGKARALLWSLPVLIVTEAVLISPAPWPIPTSPKPEIQAAEYLKSLPGDFAIFDFPDLKPGTGLFPGEIFFLQTIHNRPIPYSLEGVSRTVFHNPFYRYAHGILTGEEIPPGDPAEGIEQLARLGFGYLVYRPQMAPRDRSEAIEKVIEAHLDVDRKIGEYVIYKFRNAEPISKDWRR